MKMPRYAWLDFDKTDTQDQYAIAYNNYKDKSGDAFVLWFDTEAQRAERIKKDVSDGVVFLTEPRRASMNWLKELFFYDAETFTWSRFVLDACLAGGLLFVMYVSLWLAYIFFG
jgi:hypothetical protein